MASAAKAAVMGLLAILAGLSAARAESPSCAQLRESIYRMERESVRPPGFFELAQTIRGIYRNDCTSAPVDPVDYAGTRSWYRADGTPTGVGEDQPAPAEGAYVATNEVGSFCAARPGMEPSMCAKLAMLGQFCGQPTERQQLVSLCTALQNRPQVPPSQRLDAEKVTVDGQPYEVGDACSLLLLELQARNPQTAMAADWTPRLGAVCSPELVAALARKIGKPPTDNAFWPALGQLTLNGFGNQPGANFTQASQLRSDPGFKRMCDEAKTHRDTCLARWQNMRSVDTELLGREGQAGAFRDCYHLYADVYAMCDGVPRQTERLVNLTKPANAARATPAPAAAAGQSSGGQSAPPPKPAPPAQPQMSAQCQQLVSNYVSAAKANDGARALSGYNALKAAGGCGVLGKVDKGMPVPPPAPAPAGPDPRFVSRGATPNTDQFVQPCAADQAGCNQAVRQLQQGISPAAQAAMISHAISTGLQLGAAMASGLAAAAPPPQAQGGGSYAVPRDNTDYRTLADAVVDRRRAPAEQQPEHHHRHHPLGTAPIEGDKKR